MRRLAIVQCALIAGLTLLVGCESDGPEFPQGEVLVFEGTLDEQSSQRHFFALTNSGTVEIRLTTLTATDRETGELTESPSLNVRLGQAAGELCSATLSRSLTEGGSFAIFLETRSYCLIASASTALLEAATIEYTLTLDSAFS